MDLDNINLEMLKGLNADELVDMMPNDSKKDNAEFSANFERAIMAAGYDQDGNALIVEGESIYILTTDGHKEELNKNDTLIQLVAPMAAAMPVFQEEETKNKVCGIVLNAVNEQIKKQGGALAYVWGYGFMIDTGEEFKPVQISDIIEKKSIIPLILGGLTEEKEQEEPQKEEEEQTQEPEAETPETPTDTKKENE